MYLLTTRRTTIQKSAERFHIHANSKTSNITEICNSNHLRSTITFRDFPRPPSKLGLKGQRTEVEEIFIANFCKNIIVYKIIDYKTTTLAFVGWPDNLDKHGGLGLRIAYFSNLELTIHVTGSGLKIVRSVFRIVN